jgi:phosphoribosylglycinamide formyltransferase-1
MLRLAVLASGTGSNFQAIADAIGSGTVRAEIALLISNNPAAGVLARAASAGVRTSVLPSKGMTSPEAREQYDRRVGDEIEASGAELVVLAGYMRILSSGLIRRFPQRIVNIHPSLLPSFPGLNVHQAVLEHGCKVSGCTVHFVDEGLDSGPIIAQCAVPVLEGDTADSLANRIHLVEHKLYPWAIEQIAQDRVRVEGRRVRIDETAGNPPCYP